MKVDTFTKTKKSINSSLQVFRLKQKEISVEVVGFEESVVNTLAWEPKGNMFSLTRGEGPQTQVSFYAVEDTVRLVSKSNKTKKAFFLNFFSFLSCFLSFIFFFFFFVPSFFFSTCTHIPISHFSLLLLFSLPSFLLCSAETFEKKQINQMIWSPRGQFIVLAGLGAPMNGQLEFWNAKDQELMGTGEHFMCTDIEWDPTGRYVVSSVSAWKERVSFSITFSSSSFFFCLFLLFSSVVFFFFFCLCVFFSLSHFLFICLFFFQRPRLATTFGTSKARCFTRPFLATSSKFFGALAPLRCSPRPR